MASVFDDLVEFVRAQFKLAEVKAGVTEDWIAGFKDLCEEYRPHHTRAAFGLGFTQYMLGEYKNPFDGLPHEEVNVQAWDRGALCASRWTRIPMDGEDE